MWWLCLLLWYVCHGCIYIQVFFKQVFHLLSRHACFHTYTCIVDIQTIFSMSFQYDCVLTSFSAWCWICGILFYISLKPIVDVSQFLNESYRLCIGVGSNLKLERHSVLRALLQHGLLFFIGNGWAWHGTEKLGDTLAPYSPGSCSTEVMERTLRN